MTIKEIQYRGKINKALKSEWIKNCSNTDVFTSIHEEDTINASVMCWDTNTYELAREIFPVVLK